MTDPANAASREARAKVVADLREDMKHCPNREWFPVATGHLKTLLALADEAASQPREVRKPSRFGEFAKWWNSLLDARRAMLTGRYKEDIFDAGWDACLAALHDTAPTDQAQGGGERDSRMLGYYRMGSGGRCDWTHLREAVAEAVSGSRSHSTGFDPDFYPGHHTVAGINYNSLDRIVTAFVDAALAQSNPTDGGVA
jgi:hypothetical protein